MSLKSLGWSEQFELEIRRRDTNSALKPARVVTIHRRRLQVHDGISNFELPILGRWYSTEDEQRPAVGDWVLSSKDHPHLTELLPRLNAIKRTVTHQPEPQTIAANVDLIFIVIACTEDFNESKFERYLALAELSDTVPHIVLSKRDLLPNYAPLVKRVLRLAYRASLSVIDCRVRADLAHLQGLLQEGVTGLFMGASGVGKSTIINSLLGTEVQRTAQTRAQDHQGRHTTSSRRLFVLPGGGMIIDIPGVRELALANSKGCLELTFPDIETLIARCNFSNCSHTNEPECQIQAAQQDGVLEQRRYNNYVSLVTQSAAITND